MDHNDVLDVETRAIVAEVRCPQIKAELKELYETRVELSQEDYTRIFVLEDELEACHRAIAQWNEYCAEREEDAFDNSIHNS
jgi:5'-deoxynucleotidase YfbR-like HD superfamily hydrolase